MKQRLTWLSLLLLVLFVNPRDASACHGVALVGFSASVSGGNVIVNGSSDPATCGCGPYYMEVELACFSASNFTGAAPACTSPNWNSYPWYRSDLNVPGYSAPNYLENCVLEPYFPVSIPIASLCPGTTYVLRARERVCGSGSAGPWSTTFTFTTPGTPPNFQLQASAAPNPICAGQQSTLSATITGTGGCGSGNPTFTWTPINPAGPPIIGNPVNVAPSVTTVYQVTAGGGYLSCYGVPPVTVTVTVLPNPVAGTPSASPTIVCAGQTTTLTLTGFSGNIQWQSAPSSGGPWSNIPGGTTSPFTTSLTATTFFRAVVSNGCGSVNTFFISVTVIPAPILSVTPSNPTICAGGNVSLTASGGPSYTWSEPPPGGTLNTTTGATVIASPTATTTYTVSSSQGQCTSTLPVTVTVNPLPTPTITPPNPSLCAGDTVQLTCGPGPYANVTWAPSNGTLSSTTGATVDAFPTTPTTYTATATDANGCSDTASVTVTVNAMPVVSIFPASASLCAGQSLLLTVSGAISYAWSNGATTDTTTVSPTTPTTYTVIGTTGGSCADTATISITISPNITVEAGLPDSICPGASAMLNATPVTGATYTWTGPGTIASPGMSSTSVTPSATGTYTLNVVDPFGCTGVDSVDVLVYPAAVANAGADAQVCPGDSTQLNASGGQMYTWMPNTNLTPTNTMSNPIAFPGSTTQYTVTVTDANGCMDTDSMIVTVNQVPVVNAGPDAYLCNGSTQLNASGAVNYAWTPSTGLSATNINNPVASPASTTTYVVTGTDGNGCEDTDTVVVDLYAPLAVVASNGVAICPGNSTGLSALASGGDGQYMYSWTPAGTLTGANTSTPTATPGTTTTYTVTVSDGCSTTTVTDTVTVTVHPVPMPTITPDVTSGCAPLCVSFTGGSTPSSNQCSWDFSDGTGTGCNVSHCFTTPGSYTITLNVVDVNGCPGSTVATNMITVHPVPTAGFIASLMETTVLAPDITFTPACTYCDSVVYYLGSQDSLMITTNSFTYSFSDTGAIMVTQVVYSQYGCMDQTDVVVVIRPDFALYVPNAFSPNGDGNNEIFYAYGTGIDPEHFNMWIYDRWGNMLFHSTDIYKGWDGRVQGHDPLSQIDTYVWKIEVRDKEGNKHKYIGHLSMIR